jgi:FkbM family methyltransferase
MNEDCQIKGLLDIYNKYLPFLGTYIEGGAYDGVTHSNTSYLASKGWEGYYVEPVKEYFEKLKKNYEGYTKVYPFNIGFDAKNSIKNITVQGEFSTSNEDDLEVLKSIPYFELPKSYTQEARFTTIDNFVKELKIKKVDLLVLDTEGNEGEIIQNMKLRPYMVIIELHEDSPEWRKHERTNNNIKIAYEVFCDYDVVYKDDINTIFVKKQT